MEKPKYKINTPEYNKAYYAKNKETILSKACEKIECPFCKRSVMKNNLPHHKNTPLCARKQEQLLEEQSRNQRALMKIHNKGDFIDDLSYEITLMRIKNIEKYVFDKETTKQLALFKEKLINNNI